MKILDYIDSQDNKLIEFTDREFTALRRVIRFAYPVEDDMVLKRVEAIEDMTGIFEFCSSVMTALKSYDRLMGDKR